MEIQEIINRANDRLPSVLLTDMPVIIVPVMKDLPVLISSETLPLPNTKTYYAVEYIKSYDCYGNLFWKFNRIDER